MTPTQQLAAATSTAAVRVAATLSALSAVAVCVGLAL